MRNRAVSIWKQYGYTHFLELLQQGLLPPGDKIWLNFAGLRIDDTELIVLVDALNSACPANEIKLHLQNNNIASDGAVELAKLLAKNKVNIVEFNINNNPIGDAGVTAIYDAMLTNTKVTATHCLGASHEVYFIADMTIQACVMRNKLLAEHPQDAALIIKAAEKMDFYRPGENPIDLEEYDWSPLKECFRFFSNYYQDRAERYSAYQQQFLDYYAACTPGMPLHFMQEDNTDLHVALSSHK